VREPRRQRRTEHREGEPGGNVEKGRRQSSGQERERGRDEEERLGEHGITPLDEAMDGDWRFDRKTSTTPFRARLIQHEYTLMRPVVDPGTNTLFLNVFPWRW
jgi:hypothetical protein